MSESLCPNILFGGRVNNDDRFQQQNEIANYYEIDFSYLSSHFN